MKKLLFLISLLFVITSCSSSEEEEELIRQKLSQLTSNEDMFWKKSDPKSVYQNTECVYKWFQNGVVYRVLCTRDWEDPCRYKKWYEQNVKYVKYLIVNNRCIIVKELQQLYNVKTNFLERHGLLRCMPTYWKYIVLEKSDLEFDGYKVEKFSYKSRDTHQEMLKK